MPAKVSATRLREARTYLGFSPDDVATIIGCERSRFDDIEAGRTTVTGEELRKLSRLYMRPVPWLCGETTFQSSPEMLRQIEHLTEGDREGILDFAEFLQCKKQVDGAREITGKGESDAPHR